MNKGIGGHTKPNQGATNNWITPRWILNALGEFDLDPCACVTQPWPCATRAFTQQGLRQPWQGRVWCNPPYGSLAWGFLARLAEHGDGIALVFARTETQGFHRTVWQRATGLLFFEKRIHFCHTDGMRAKGNAGGPSVLVAYGESNYEALRTSGLNGAVVHLESNGTRG